MNAENQTNLLISGFKGENFLQPQAISPSKSPAPTPPPPPLTPSMFYRCSIYSPQRSDFTICTNDFLLFTAERMLLRHERYAVMCVSQGYLQHSSSTTNLFLVKKGRKLRISHISTCTRRKKEHLELTLKMSHPPLLPGEDKVSITSPFVCPCDSLWP